MATIIVRTNPNKKITSGGTMWECSICGRKFVKWDDASDCAKADHKARVAKREAAAKAVAAATKQKGKRNGSVSRTRKPRQR